MGTTCFYVFSLTKHSLQPSKNNLCS